jgi:hypothetical protein
MPTSAISLSISSYDGHGAQVSGFPSVPNLAWTGEQPTVRTFTLTGETDTAIVVPSGAKLMAMPLTDAFNLVFKGHASDVGVPLCDTSNALGLPLVFPLGDDPTPVIENLEADDIDVTVYFF